MRNDEDNELWKDILSEVAPGEFRDALLSQTLTRTRRRKQTRRLGRVAMVITLIAGASFFLWRPDTNKRADQPRLEVSTVNEIRSNPLASEKIVSSVPGAVEMVTSHPSAVVVVETEPMRQDFREINDEELMRFTGGKPAALVRTGPHKAELLIVDARGQNMIKAGEQGIQQ